MKRSLAIASIIAGSLSWGSKACIWQDGDQPFWPSNDIEVCFLSPAEHTAENPALIRAYNEARSNIQRVAQQQFNTRNTGFKLFGFKTCDYDYRRQGAKDDLPPMIRIELHSEFGKNHMELTDGMIGPVNGKKSVNLYLSYAHEALDKKTHTRSWRFRSGDPEFMKMTLHELLHTFGIHHAYYWNEPENLEKVTQGRYVKVGDSMDKESVLCTVQGCSQKGPVLSDGDIRCLRLISNRTIKGSAASVRKAHPAGVVK